MRTITLLVVHCSGVQPHQSSSVRQIDEWHHQAGYSNGIGYHYVVRRDGTVEPGRPEEVVGAHVKNHNRYSLGICYEGGLDAAGRPADTRTPAQKQALRTLLEELHAIYPRACIVGHRDLSPDRNGDGQVSRNEWVKECPCFDAIAEYRDLQPIPSNP